MVILPADAAKLHSMGHALDQMGVKIEAMVSSPQPRCVRTGLLILEGANQTPRVSTNNLLDDLTSSPGVDRAALKAAAKAAGVETEQYVITAPEIAKIMEARGSEGKIALVNIICLNNGNMTVLVPCHGGSRMEVTLLTLLGKNTIEQRRKIAEGQHETVRMFDHCAMAELILDQHGCSYLHYLTDADLGLSPES